VFLQKADILITAFIFFTTKGGNLMATLIQAKRDFDLGVLKSFAIHRNQYLNGWSLTMDYNGVAVYIVDARGKLPRLFKSLDSAVHAAEHIGFKVTSLRFSNGS
jgi:hypothetical protein